MTPMKESKKKGKGIILPLIKLCLVVIFVAYAAGGILGNWEQYAQRKAAAEELQAKVAAQHTLNAALEEDALQTAAAAQWIRSGVLAEGIGLETINDRIARDARDRAGYVKPNEYIIVDMTPR